MVLVFSSDRPDRSLLDLSNSLSKQKDQWVTKFISKVIESESHFLVVIIVHRFDELKNGHIFNSADYCRGCTRLVKWVGRNDYIKKQFLSNVWESL